MITHICSCCGQTLKAKRQPAPIAPAATADMSDKQLFAYYKRTAPALDCAFIVAREPRIASMVPDQPTAKDATRMAEAFRMLRSDEHKPNEVEFWHHVSQMPDWWKAGQSKDANERLCGRNPSFVPADEPDDPIEDDDPDALEPTEISACA